MIVIGAGKSIDQVKDILDKFKDLKIAVNYTAKDFDYDIMLALDFEPIKEMRDKIKGKIIISRDWGDDFHNRFTSESRVIKLRNNIINHFKFSGDLAVYIAEKVKELKPDIRVLTFGIDGGKGHYSGYKEQNDADYGKKKRGKAKEPENSIDLEYSENKGEIIRLIEEVCKRI